MRLDNRHTYGYTMCSSSRRLVILFVWGRLHTGASPEKRKEASPILKLHIQLYWWCLSLNNYRFGDFVDRIYCTELEIPWPTTGNRRWGAVKNEILRQKRWFQFPHCEPSIYLWQHSSSTWTYRTYMLISVETIFTELVVPIRISLILYFKQWNRHNYILTRFFPW